MNDLMQVRQVLGEPEPPSPAARATARSALLRAAATRTPVRDPRAGRRRHRAGWLAGGACLAATAAAVFAVMTAGTPPPPGTAGTAGGKDRAISRLSGRQILLDAATATSTEPASTGTYWHVKVTTLATAGAGITISLWLSHSGVQYDLAPDGTAVRQDGTRRFPAGTGLVTFQQLQELPADPGALQAWILRSFRHPVAGIPGSPLLPRLVSSVPRSAVHETLVISLIDLLYHVPASPAVRAAAFRALASMPGVTVLGQVHGGTVLRIASTPDDGEIKVIIDNLSHSLRSWSDSAGTTDILAAGWTDQIP